MFSSSYWFIAVFVVVAELESSIRALLLKRNFLGGNVLQKQRDYHLFNHFFEAGPSAKSYGFGYQRST